MKLNLQSFGHLMWRTDSLEKTTMQGKIEGGRRRGWQRMRWLDGITDSIHTSLSYCKGEPPAPGQTLHPSVGKKTPLLETQRGTMTLGPIWCDLGAFNQSWEYLCFFVSFYCIKSYFISHKTAHANPYRYFRWKWTSVLIVTWQMPSLLLTSLFRRCWVLWSSW